MAEDELATQAELIRRQAAEIALLRADNVALQAELRLTADPAGRSDSSGQATHEGAGRADGTTVAESGGGRKQPLLAREDRDAAHDDGETKASSTDTSTDNTSTNTSVRTPPSYRPPGWRSTFWSWLSSTKQSRADDGYDGDSDGGGSSSNSDGDSNGNGNGNRQWMPSRATSSSASLPHGRGITKSASSPALSAAFPGVELQRSQRSQRSPRNPRNPRSQRHGGAAKSRGDPERVVAQEASDTTASDTTAPSSASSSSSSATCAPPPLSTYTSKKSREVAALASGSPGFDVNETRCSDVRLLALSF